MIKFRCDACGNVFEGIDAEWMATPLTAPQQCPNCGSNHTYPNRLGLGILNKMMYKPIWHQLDKNAKED